MCVPRSSSHPSLRWQASVRVRTAESGADDLPVLSLAIHAPYRFELPLAEDMLQWQMEVYDMATAEERMEILRMVQGGQVTAEEGAALLEALGEDDESRPRKGGSVPSQQPRRLRVRVSDLETGRKKVNIDLPWNLINVGMHMGARFAPEEIDLEAVMQALQAGTEGKIVDVEDAKDNERVEIFVE